MNNIKGLEFHIESEDYFGTLATRLDLLRQIINDKNNKLDKEKFLSNCVDELLYLQQNYKIELK